MLVQKGWARPKPSFGLPTKHGGRPFEIGEPLVALIEWVAS